jgi:hypothetical protein
VLHLPRQADTELVSVAAVVRYEPEPAPRDSNQLPHLTAVEGGLRAHNAADRVGPASLPIMPM